MKEAHHQKWPFLLGGLSSLRQAKLLSATLPRVASV